MLKLILTSILLSLTILLTSCTDTPEKISQRMIGEWKFDVEKMLVEVGASDNPEMKNDIMGDLQNARFIITDTSLISRNPKQTNDYVSLYKIIEETDHRLIIHRKEQEEILKFTIKMKHDQISMKYRNETVHLTRVK